MAKHKRPTDANQRAKLVVDIATGGAEDDHPADAPPTPAERGRLGGIKGGKARAKALTPEDRAEQASKAAKARWSRDV
ncbi:MAG: histone H1 [Actinomycetota bacterium]